MVPRSALLWVCMATFGFIYSAWVNLNNGGREGVKLVGGRGSANKLAYCHDTMLLYTNM